MNKLLWLDMEMTGLDVDSEMPIEVAVIVTDKDFNELDRYQAIIKQPKHYLDNMDAWNTEHHGASGLLAKIPSGENQSDVEEELCSLVDKHFSKEDPPVLAGNSIHHDRLFIKKHFKKLNAKLHYRMLDVSSWKIIVKERYGFEFEKQNRHRAVEDIEESIGEMKSYLDFFENKMKKKPPGVTPGGQ